MSSRIPRSLLSLAIGGFGIGLTEFVIMGLLPDVAKAMNVTIAQAGHYIAAYALGVVVGAPLLVIAGRNLPPKKMLLALMTLFTVFNGLSALAPNSTALLILRFLSGLPHGAYFGVGAVVAGRIAGPGKAASAFAVMLSGLTICNIIGVPIATYIGQMVSWRASFALVAVVGVATLIAISMTIPDFESENKGGSVRQDFVIFKNPSLWYAIVIASIGFGGFFAWFSYITPLLTNVTGVSKEYVPYFLSLAGVGMTVGNWMGGRMADSMSAIKAVVYLLIAMISVLILDSLLASHLIPMIFLTFTTGAIAMAMGAPIQIILINSSKESPLLGSSIGQGAFNLGNSLGAFLGGLPLAAGLTFNSPLWVGAGLAFTGLIVAIKLFRKGGKIDLPVSKDQLMH
ncbi:MFS transporter [Bdellovibrio sp. HCB288]|uniref:MFS transporter n=1 Tax=Bdellovibrio sp. HCB288 TaxID=3394355 RepID=UPI0039B5EF94